MANLDIITGWPQVFGSPFSSFFSRGGVATLQYSILHHIED